MQKSSARSRRPEAAAAAAAAVAAMARSAPSIKAKTAYLLSEADTKQLMDSLRKFPPYKKKELCLVPYLGMLELWYWANLPKQGFLKWDLLEWLLHQNKLGLPRGITDTAAHLNIGRSTFHRYRKMLEEPRHNFTNSMLSLADLEYLVGLYQKIDYGFVSNNLLSLLTNVFPELAGVLRSVEAISDVRDVAKAEGILFQVPYYAGSEEYLIRGLPRMVCHMELLYGLVLRLIQECASVPTRHTLEYPLVGVIQQVIDSMGSTCFVDPEALRAPFYIEGVGFKYVLL